MITIKDINDTKLTKLPPNKGPWIVSESGKIIPFSSKNENLDWIADVQIAPGASRNIPVICAASLMFDALKIINADPKSKKLSLAAREAMQEALTAAE